jgi:hypothetical protein
LLAQAGARLKVLLQKREEWRIVRHGPGRWRHVEEVSSPSKIRPAAGPCSFY